MAVVGVGPNVSEIPKNAVELPDGRLVVTGYANVDGIVKGRALPPDPSGRARSTYGTEGVTIAQLLGNAAESYAVTLAGNRLVTTGYGKDITEAKVDLITGGFTLDGRLGPQLRHAWHCPYQHRRRGRPRPPRRRAPQRRCAAGRERQADGEQPRRHGGQAHACWGGRHTFGTNGRQLFNIGGPNDAFFGVALSPV